MADALDPAALLPTGQLQQELFEIMEEGEPGALRVYTNIMNLWDMLPKYDVWGITKRYHTDLPMEDRVRVIPVRHRPHREALTPDEDDELFAEIELEIHPALISRKKIERFSEPGPNGKRKQSRRVARDSDGNPVMERVYVFPGVREDKIEEALKLLLAHGQGEWETEKSGVRFTVRQIYRELARTGNKYNIDEIKEGLEVLRKARCTIYGIESGTGRRKSVIDAPFLPAVLLNDRNTYESKLEAGEDTRCYAQMHPLVSEGIRQNQFRLTNYLKHQRLDNLLARFIHKVLRIGFTAASSPNTPYKLSMNQTLMEYGRFNERSDNNYSVFKTALQDLESNGILSKWEVEDIRDQADRRIIHDRYFLCYPTQEFVDEVVRANSKSKRNSALLEEFSNVRELGRAVKALPKRAQKLVRRLREFGIAMPTALELVDEHSVERIESAITQLEETEHKKPKQIRNRTGLLISLIRKGADGAAAVTASEEMATIAEPAGDEQQVNVNHLAALNPEQQAYLLKNWNSWKPGDRATFNRYGLASPHVRDVLFADI